MNNPVFLFRTVFIRTHASLSFPPRRHVILTRDDETVLVMPRHRRGGRPGSGGVGPIIIIRRLYRRPYLSHRLWNATVWCTARSRLGRNVFSRAILSSRVFATSSSSWCINCIAPSLRRGLSQEREPAEGELLHVRWRRKNCEIGRLEIIKLNLSPTWHIPKFNCPRQVNKTVTHENLEENLQELKNYNFSLLLSSRASEVFKAISEVLWNIVAEIVTVILHRFLKTC